MKARKGGLSNKVRKKLKQEGKLNYNLNFICKNINLPLNPPKGCPDIFPVVEPPPLCDVLEAEVFQYTTISDGMRNIYTNADRLPEYGSTNILDPNEVTFINLFINGILQPAMNYVVEPGILKLTTEDLPVAGVPIILQFVKIYGC